VENAIRDDSDSGRSNDTQDGLQNAIFEVGEFRVAGLCRRTRY
jgi:hypothetical protein